MEEIEEDPYTINIFQFTSKYYAHYFKLMWIHFLCHGPPPMNMNFNFYLYLFKIIIRNLICNCLSFVPLLHCKYKTTSQRLAEKG